jgi:predicted Zn-dependent peptidase
LIDHLDLRWWHRERLRPDDATLIVVGDVDAGTLRGKLEAQLSGWVAPQKRKELPQIGKLPPQERRLLGVNVPGKSQAVLMIGEPGVPRKHPDYFPILVMNAILGGQFNSRINMNLREKHGYAYSAYSEFAFGRDAGPFAVRASVKGDMAKASVDEVFKEFSAIRGADVSTAELRQAKDLLTRSLARRFETVLQVAAELSAIEVFKLPDNYLSTYADRVEAVTVADVRRVAQTYLDPSRMAVVAVGDKKDLDKLAELNLGAIEYKELFTLKDKTSGRSEPRNGPTSVPAGKPPGKLPTP